MSRIQRALAKHGDNEHVKLACQRAGVALATSQVVRVDLHDDVSRSGLHSSRDWYTAIRLQPMPPPLRSAPTLFFGYVASHHALVN